MIEECQLASYHDFTSFADAEYTLFPWLPQGKKVVNNGDNLNIHWVKIPWISSEKTSFSDLLRKTT